MIEEMYEESDDCEPFFVFTVTMQNHGGYTVSYSNFYQQIYTTNLSASYTKANRYLSLVKETDEAFEQLVEYFSDVDEPTIICMFGDHLPSLETEFYEELLGADLDNLTTEQEMLRYEIPFVIWANYDIEEAEVEHISSNYLSTLLSQAAGLPMTQYNKYLAALYQTLPVISTVGYVDGDGVCYSASEENPYADILLQYNCITYNCLLDEDNREDSLFYLED
ncbi:MAG: sulfatase-like hydrolase/transferase, partial [Lachnospiraceae bacterium]|nr:sulfatase-like hydrolase/transferase [Lachnospiraceae bacterium]